MKVAWSGRTDAKVLFVQILIGVLQNITFIHFMKLALRNLAPVEKFLL